MAFDERLFALTRGALRDHGAVGDDAAITAAAVAFPAVQRRLEIIARLVGGAAFAVRSSTGIGGVGRDAVTVPARIAATADRQRNLRLLVHRVVFAAMARDLDLVLPTCIDRALGELVTLLAVPTVQVAMELRFPGVLDLARCARTTARALALGELRHDDALGTLELLVLGTAADELAPHVDGAVLDWALDASSRRPAAHELEPVARWLLRALPARLRGRPGRARLDAFGRLDLADEGVATAGRVDR